MNRNEDQYFNSIHRIGRISVTLVILSFIAVPLLMSIVYHVPVNVAQTATAAGAILSFMAPLAIGEFLAYAPILGTSLYLSLMTGNTTNMKIPAMISSLEMETIDPQSKEGEIVKILAVGSSALLVTVVLFIGMFALTFLLPVLNSPVLAPAFNNVIPCMMGALFMPSFLKNPKGFAFPALLILAVSLVMGYEAASAQQAVLLIAALILTTVWDFLGMKRKASRLEQHKN